MTNVSHNLLLTINNNNEIMDLDDSVRLLEVSMRIEASIYA